MTKLKHSLAKPSFLTLLLPMSLALGCEPAPMESDAGSDAFRWTTDDAAAGAEDTGIRVRADSGADDTGAESGDVGPPDAWVDPDPCSSTVPAASVGCNGPIPGPQPPRTSGGRCSLRMECTEGECAQVRNAPEGMCVVPCVPGSPFRITTSTCAAGFRCWPASESDARAGICLPDCSTGADCASGVCSDTAYDLPMFDQPPTTDTTATATETCASATVAADVPAFGNALTIRGDLSTAVEDHAALASCDFPEQVVRIRLYRSSTFNAQASPGVVVTLRAVTADCPMTAMTVCGINRPVAYFEYGEYFVIIRGAASVGPYTVRIQQS